MLLLVVGICGSLGKAFGGFSRGGWLVSIGLGFVGALVGVFSLRLDGAALPLQALIPLSDDGRTDEIRVVLG